MVLKLVTWNVNGLRAILKKNFNDFVKEHQPDILCLQETKLQAHLCPPIEGFQHTYFNYSEFVKGYSGTAIFSNIAPQNVRCLDLDPKHPEGRIVVFELSKFYLVDVYVPNSQDGLRRLTYRTEIWDVHFRKFLAQLQETKPIIVCGDFNVAHQPIDLASPDVHHFDAGFTDEERSSFSQHLDIGLIDVFRSLHPELGQQYTWWSYRTQARTRNIGWRLDYFLVSKALLPYVQNCIILKDVFGSDHAPVQLELDHRILD